MQSLAVTFNLRIKPRQIYEFRGAFIDLIRKSDVITKEQKEVFSNRIDTGHDVKGKPIHRYPQIQYRIDDGRASIWALKDACPILQKIIHSGILNHFSIKEKRIPLSIAKERHQEIDLIVTKEQMEYEYLLFHFVPFNNVKEKEYHLLHTMVEKVKFIEQSILNELVLLMYQLEVSPTHTLKVELIDIILKSKAKYKTKNQEGNMMEIEPQSYFLKFRTNIKIPDGVSIGRHKAYGYGIIHQPM